MTERGLNKEKLLTKAADAKCDNIVKFLKEKHLVREGRDLILFYILITTTTSNFLLFGNWCFS